MAIYTYVKNVDPNNPNKVILLRNGQLQLYLGSYANITNEELFEARGNGQYVLEAGIIPPAVPASSSSASSNATIIYEFQTYTKYLKGQAIQNKGTIYIAKTNFESEGEFKLENWEVSSGEATGALKIINNLSDVESAEKSRKNIGIGSAGGHYEATFGNGSATTFTLVHKLNTLTPDVTVINQSTALREGCKVKIINAEELELSATAWTTTPPTTAAYRVSVDASSGIVATTGSTLTSFVEKGEIGANNGVIPADSKGLLPEARLPVSAVNSRVVAGAPTTGTWATYQAIIDSTGVEWICTAGGTPGTWIQGVGLLIALANGGDAVVVNV